MNIRKVLCLLTMLACAAENCLAAEGDNLAASIYNHAHFRNREAEEKRLFPGRNGFTRQYGALHRHYAQRRKCL